MAEVLEVRKGKPYGSGHGSQANTIHRGPLSPIAECEIGELG